MTSIVQSEAITKSKQTVSTCRDVNRLSGKAGMDVGRPGWAWEGRDGRGKAMMGVGSP